MNHSIKSRSKTNPIWPYLTHEGLYFKESFPTSRKKTILYERRLIERILCNVSVLTYLLTPWCRFLLEKLTGLQLVKKFPAFYGTRRFITALKSVRHLSLSWASPIQSTYPHPTSWRSILIPINVSVHSGKNCLTFNVKVGGCVLNG